MTEQKPATYKQIEFAKKLGIENPQDYSLGDLRTLINDKVVKTEEGNGDVPVVKPGSVEYTSRGSDKVEQSKPVKEFHLSPEQVNTNALNAAIEALKAGFNGQVLKDLPEIARKFKEFIENGN